MNKKIFTLLAAGLMGGLSVNAAPSAGYVKDQLHQLTANGKVLSVVQSKVSSADSLVMISAPTDQMSDAFKKTLWKISETNVDNTTTTVYTLKNYATGSVLSLNLAKTDGTIAAGQSSWLINDSYAGSVTDAITAIKNGVRYGIYLETVLESDGITAVVLPNGTNDYKVRLGKVSDNSPVQFTFSQPADITNMSKDQINGLYGTSSSFTFSKKAEGNPIDGVAFRAETATTAGYVNLRLNDGKYLVVDTAVWKNAVNTNSYWRLTTDSKPEAATSGISSDITTATVLKNGRATETYAFQVSLSIKKGYQMTITPYAVPVYANSAEQSGKQTVFSYDVKTNTRALAYGQFASSTLVLTASENYTGDNLETATAVFGVVETPNALDGKYTYYIQDYNTYNAAGSARNSNYTKYIYFSDCDDAVMKAKSTLAIPGYMWYLTAQGALVNMLDNQAQGTTRAGAITLIDEANSVYAFGTDTLKLTKGPKVVDAQKMGYKIVSAADEANGALSFRLVSALAQDLYVVEDKNGVLYVANGELSDALKLKVVSVDNDVDNDGELDYATWANSNGVVIPKYQLTDRLGQRTLVTDMNDENFGLMTGAQIAALNSNTQADGTTLDTSDDVYPVVVSFLSMGNENEYKIVFVNALREERALTANAASGIITSTYVCDDQNIIFEFAKKDAPVYGAPAFGHVQITTLEDDNKMIAPQLDGFAALKAEGQILKSDVYTNDTLKLWLDTALVDDIMPLYYLSSSAFNEEGDLRNYLMNPSNYSIALNAARKENPFEFEAGKSGNYTAIRAAFAPASEDEHKCIVIEKDTISTIELNPAAIAFEVAAEISENAYRIVSPLDKVNDSFNPANPVSENNLPYVTDNYAWYLAQLNNVLFWTQDYTKAEVFVINRTTAPTANEAVEAETVKVIGGQGVVTVQGAAGKVITVANILGQTIANQVAASDNVTIAAPAGVVVVSVDGEATKVVVK